MVYIISEIEPADMATSGSDPGGHDCGLADGSSRIPAEMSGHYFRKRSYT